MNKAFGAKIVNATKWSTLTEILVKLVLPVTNMFLARILTPNQFGIVATITIISSFAEIFADAGFQKYLVQHEFDDNDDLNKSTNVAFWTNLALSLLVWFVIIFFRNSLAELVGSPQCGFAVAVSCSVIPITGLTSIQMARYRRDFDYKTLFYVRIIGAVVPLLFTVPLAYYMRNYWALIFGNIVTKVLVVILLCLRSRWKPSLNYDVERLFKMISFSLWTLLESISIWMTSYIGTFIVGRVLNEYYIGIYKTSMSTVNSYMDIVIASTTSVLFSTLSRLQNDDKSFFETFLKFQRLVAMLVLPMGAGLFMYRDLATMVLLGAKWHQAAGFIGIWSLTSAFTIVFSNYNSEIFRSKGKPKLSLLVQLLHLVVLVPALIIAAKYDFTTLYLTRSLVRLQMIAVSLAVVKICCGFSIIKIFKNVFAPFVSTCVMVCVAAVMQHFTNGMLWDFVGVAVCIVVYFGMIMCFPSMRTELLTFIRSYVCKRRDMGKKNR